jgi:predicted ribosome quality control (RQC) complex YloA/Tae2 family protein
MADPPSLRQEWEGGRVQRISQPRPHAFLLELYTGRSINLWLSTHPKHGGVFEVDCRHSNPASPSVFCLWLRKLLLNAVLESAEAWCPQCVCLKFRRNTPTGPEVSLLVWEDNGPRSNLLLLDEQQRLHLALFNPNQAARKLSQGKPYAFPVRWSAPASGQCELQQGESEEALWEEACSLWRQRLRKIQRHWQRMQENQEADAVKSARFAEVRQRADLLKTQLGQIQPGSLEVEVVNYFDPELPLVRLVLDAQLSPQEQVVRMYQRAEKLEKSIPHVRARFAQTSGELEELAERREQLGALQTASEWEAWLADLPEWLLRAARRLEQKVPERTSAPATPEPLIRISSDDLEIWIGRNARENEVVSFRWARGNDWWFHVQDAGGAHVVVHAPHGELPPRTLEEAALLAAYYSRLRLEHSVEVDYTRRKFVRKLKGKAPGRVTFSQNRSVRISLNADRIQHILSRTA